MSTRSKLAKGALALVATATAFSGLAIPSLASAQSAYDSRGYNYDACRRDKVTRGTTGAVIGGVLGAVIGSNVAARGVRTEGAVLGGAVGAAGGAAIGNSSAACQSGYSSSYDGRYSDGRYDDRGYSDRRYSDGRYYDSYDSGYRGDDYMAYRNARAGSDGCTLAESPIYLPDGRVEKRFVRVCEDSRGRYHVVD